VAIPVSKFSKLVVAVEANPRTFRYLRCNVILNIAENIELIPLAASSDFSKVKFIAGEINSGGSKIFPKIAHPHYFEAPHEILDVDGGPLDKILQDRVFKVIFMDIEGSEFSALCGMRLLLARTELLFVEFIPAHLEFVAQVSPEEFAELLQDFFDYLFVPKLGGFVEKQNFPLVLRRLYDLNISEDQIVFSKNKDYLVKIFGL
jgi:FkbM family methyltransferase